MIEAKISHPMAGEDMKVVIYPNGFLLDGQSEDEDAKLLGEDILGWIEQYGTPLRVTLEIKS